MKRTLFTRAEIQAATGLSRRQISVAIMSLAHNGHISFSSSHIGYDIRINKNNKMIRIDSKRQPQNKFLPAFGAFYQAFPGARRELTTEFNDFRSRFKNISIIIDKLVPALQYQINFRRKQAANGKFVADWKTMSRWIRARDWELTGLEKATTEEPQGAMFVPFKKYVRDDD